MRPMCPTCKGTGKEWVALADGRGVVLTACHTCAGTEWQSAVPEDSELLPTLQSLRQKLFILQLGVGVVACLGLWVYGTLAADLYFAALGAVLVVLLAFLAVRLLHLHRWVIFAAASVAGLSVLWALIGGPLTDALRPAPKPPPVKEFDQLLAELADADPEVRGSASREIRQLRPLTKEALLPLGKLLADTDAGVRREAADTLAQLVPSLMERDRDAAAEIVPFLTAALRADDTAAQRVAVAEILVAIDKPKIHDALPVLTPLLQSTDQAVAIRAVQVLGSAGPEAAPTVPDLLQLVKQSRSLDLRIEAATALAEVDPVQAREALPVLITIVEKIDKAMEGRLERSPTNFKAAQIQVAQKMLFSKVLSQRERALRALRRIDPEAAKQTGVP